MTYVTALDGYNLYFKGFPCYTVSYALYSLTI